MRSKAISAALAFVALGVAGPLATAAKAEQIEMQLSPDAALDMAQRALDVKRPELAASIAEQVLAQTPGHSRASLILAAAYSRQGNAAAAERAGRMAYRLGQSADARFEAAFVTASALAAQDQPARARLWLRRADTHAQSPSDTRLLRHAFQNVDRRTPWRLTFQLSGGPSENVNGGSLHDTFWISGIFPVPIDEALPGFVLQGQAKLTYRIRETATEQMSVYAIASSRTVWLGDRARTIDPDARGHHYGSFGLDLGVQYRARASESLGYGIEVQVGQRALAGTAKRNSQRVKLSADKRLSANRLLSVSTSLTAHQDPAGAVKPSVALSAEVALGQTLGKGAVTARLGYDAVLTDARGLAWQGPFAGLDWQLPPSRHGVDLSVFGSVQLKDYWKTANDPDLALSIGGEAKFNRLSVMGFAPTVNLQASRGLSDVVVRDVSDASLTLGLSSTF